MCNVHYSLWTFMFDYGVLTQTLDLKIEENVGK